MKKIAIISDTHSTLDNKVIEYIKDCDQIWHAGDIGNIDIADTLESLSVLKAVHGNIDDYIVRNEYPECLIFDIEDIKVLMIHRGGYPKKYLSSVRALIEKEKPQIVVCGHSHILKVVYDHSLNHLHINPGACGNYGIHSVKTAIRLSIDKDHVSDMEILELPRHCNNKLNRE